MTSLRIFLACMVLGAGIILAYDGDLVAGLPVAALGLLLVDRWVR